MERWVEERWDRERPWVDGDGFRVALTETVSREMEEAMERLAERVLSTGRRLGMCPGPLDGVLVRVSEVDKAEGVLRGIGRDDVNRLDDRQDMRISKSNRIGITGGICEVVAEKYLGVKPASRVHEGSGFSRAARKPDNKLFEVKGTDRSNGRLIVPAGPSFKHKRWPNVRYLLARWDERASMVQLVGWQWGREFLHPRCLDRSLPFPAYVAPWLWEFGTEVEAE